MTADNQAMCAYLACVFNKALEFKQTEKVRNSEDITEEKYIFSEEQLEITRDIKS